MLRGPHWKKECLGWVGAGRGGVVGVVVVVVVVVVAVVVAVVISMAIVVVVVITVVPFPRANPPSLVLRDKHRVLVVVQHSLQQPRRSLRCRRVGSFSSIMILGRGTSPWMDCSRRTTGVDGGGKWSACCE